ncbi:hemolysin [Bacteroidia bacterium]|nr:hemolysin [Bacteroidia bacterium]
MNEKKIELRSEEMQEIFSRPPHWLIRGGISIICLVIICLLAGSYFFKYPDKVTGQVVITTEHPPVWLVAQAGGKIKELYCTDKASVTKGSILAVIENPAVTGEVVFVKNQLIQSCLTDSVFYIPDTLLHANYELGAIQNTYSMFLRSANNYRNFCSYNTIEKEKEALNLQIKGHYRYTRNLHQQLKLKQEELRLAKATYDREKQLYEKGVIAASEMETAENIYLSVRQAVQQMQTGLSSDAIESAQLSESLSKLDTQYENQRNTLLSEVQTAYGELLSVIENWEQTCLFISPIDGTAGFHSIWTRNQFLRAGDKALSVVPEDAGATIGRIQTAAAGSGKIKTGQRVNIKVDGYPYMEYGSLQAEVRSISLISNEQMYAVEVAFPKGLQTNTRKTLPFTGELTGTAEIITDDRSLLIRILDPLIYGWRDRFIGT